jgi:hypothetical protein
MQFRNAAGLVGTALIDPIPSRLILSQRILTLIARAILVIAIFTAPHAPVHANTVCSAPDPATGTQDCISSVNLQKFAQTAYETQQATEWCWAASISMIWAFYGHPVAQTEIVSGTFGQLLNQGGQPWQIFQALNGQREGDNGVPFVSTVTGLYDALSGYDSISYTDIGASLDQNRPVLIGTQNPDGSGAHATVLSSLEYLVPYGYPIEIFPDGSNILNAVVFDPWPTSGGIHSIPWPQFTPASQGGNLFFAALVSVSNTQSTSSGGSTGSGTGSGSGSGSGGTGLLDWPMLALLAVLVLRTLVAARNVVSHEP